MKTNEQALNDKGFLKLLAKQRVQELYTKIEVLSWENVTIGEIQGLVLSGSLNINGESAIRRTCSLTLSARGSLSQRVLDVEGLLSLNKKVKLTIGVSNTINLEYPEIIWFPQGYFIIISSNFSKNVNSYTVSLQLKDKMVLLNGEVGGVLPAPTQFDRYDILTENGSFVTKKPTIKQIVQESVQHFGEDNAPIIISDIPDKIVKVMKWEGDKPLYVYIKDEQIIYSLIDKDVSGTDIDKFIFTFGQDVGYVLEDFYYPKELVGNAGDNVYGSALEPIKKLLGNYEYFYTREGVFIFREKKNYLNTTHSTLVLQDMTFEDYQTDFTNQDYEYDFTNEDIIISYANTPKYDMIKNDFIVWGKRGTKDATKAIRYHLAIDEKPIPQDEKFWAVVFNDNAFQGSSFRFQDDDIFEYSQIKNNTIDKTTLKQSNMYRVKYYSPLPEGVQCSFSNDNYVYYGWDVITESYRLFFDQNFKSYLDNGFMNDLLNYYNSINGDIDLTSTTREAEIDDNALIRKKYQEYLDKFKIEIKEVKEVNRTADEIDWRDYIYLEGYKQIDQSSQSDVYFRELMSEWGKIYDSVEGEYLVNIIDRDSYTYNPDSIDFFLDILDTRDENSLLPDFLKKISVNKIGRRTKILNDDNINCLFEPKTLDCIIVQGDQGNDTLRDVKNFYDFNKGKNYKMSIVSSEIYNQLAIGGRLNSAFEAVKDLLYQYTNYNETITIQCLPLYFLEPNTRIRVTDYDSGISGDYEILSMSIPLQAGQTMSIQAKRCLKKI